jgi:carboxypeptidase C (cathepsin A)
LIDFLGQFFEEFQDLKHNPLYIFGISFAGHFIPVLAKKILENS